MTMPIAATFLSLPAQFDCGSPTTASPDDSGHNVHDDFLNLASQQQTFPSERRRLVGWSTTEHLSRAVPRVEVHALRTGTAGRGPATLKKPLPDRTLLRRAGSYNRRLTV